MPTVDDADGRCHDAAATARLACRPSARHLRQCDAGRLGRGQRARHRPDGQSAEAGRRRSAGAVLGRIRPQGWRGATARLAGSRAGPCRVLHQRCSWPNAIQTCQLMIAARGHPVTDTGRSQGTLPPYLTEDAEHADIARVRRGADTHRPAAIRKAGSVRAARRARNTSRLLAQAGFTWHADMFDADTPYRSTHDGAAWWACPSPWR